MWNDFTMHVTLQHIYINRGLDCLESSVSNYMTSFRTLWNEVVIGDTLLDTLSLRDIMLGSTEIVHPT